MTIRNYPIKLGVTVIKKFLVDTYRNLILVGAVNSAVVGVFMISFPSYYFELEGFFLSAIYFSAVLFLFGAAGALLDTPKPVRAHT